MCESRYIFFGIYLCKYIVEQMKYSIFVIYLHVILFVASSTPTCS
jgi:hypothetical protein